MEKVRPQKTTAKAKEPIILRFKNLANGNKSLYFDIYESPDKNSEGKIIYQRKYEFLKLYLIPEIKPADRKKNEATLLLANTIKSKRIVDMQTKSSGLSIKKVVKVNLIEFVSDIANKAFADSTNKRSEYYTFNSLAYHLKAYKGDSVNINSIDKLYINGFIDYLKTAKNGNFEGQETQPTISVNTAHKLYAKFGTVLKKALRAEIISLNPADKIEISDRPKAKPSKREYLTIDEIKKLITTDCKRPVVKNAFLFCCLVGIRFSNVKNIVWSDIAFAKTGATLSYKQIKVDTFETLPISNEALNFLPADTDMTPESKIFPLPKTETVNDILREWIKKAGIKKTITFHSSRHTAATLQLSLGTPIETVSKLLGHGKISTTQIYAKIINKNKVDAVDKQNGLFNL